MPVMQKSENQSTTYDAIGAREDYSPIITNIDPDLTFFLSNFGTANDAENLSFNWLTEGLKPPRQNANLEMTDYKTEKVGSVERRSNNCQYFINTGKVSDAQRQVRKVYTQQDEFIRQKEIAFKQQARDLEYALVSNSESRTEAGTLPAITGGVPYFLSEEVEDVTFTAASNTGETATDLKLETGDFVYFKTKPGASNKLPAEISENLAYYIRKDTANPKKFTLYDDLEAAIKGTNGITLSSAGAGCQMVKNNIVSAGGTAFTEDMINDCMEMCFKRGGNPTLAVMSGRNKRNFSKIVTGGSEKRRDSKEKKAVNVTDVYESDFGTVRAQAHRMYGDSRIDIMDMSLWDIKWFARPHEVQNLAKKGSYSEFVLEAWFGLQGTQPKASGSIVGIKRS